MARVGTTIEVTGVPCALPDKQMIDKLTIHFLRPRNGGGEVQMVTWPTSCRGQAFVTFETEEVAASALQATHVLEVQGRAYPLMVSKTDRPEVDICVSVTLDLSLFPHPEQALVLLERQGFSVPRSSSSRQHLQGSFLRLRRLRTELQRLLVQQNRNQSPISSSPSPLDGRPTSYHLNGVSPGALLRMSSPMTHGVNSIAESRRRGNDWGEIPSPSPPASLPAPLPASSLSASSDSPRSLSQSESPRASLARPRPASAHRARELSFPLDTDILRYIRCFRGDDVREVERIFGIVMRDNENPGISTVVLSGGDCDGARTELQSLAQEVMSLLRAQTIRLAEHDHDQQIQIGKRILLYKDLYKVFVSQEDDIIRLVGSSHDSYEMMQRLLGREVTLPMSGRSGREGARGPRDRRSSSLPRQPKRNNPRELETKPQVSTATGYSPQPSTQHRPSPQRRSNSESEERIRASRAKGELEDYVAPSSGGKNTSNNLFPGIKKFLKPEREVPRWITHSKK